MENKVAKVCRIASLGLAVLGFAGAFMLSKPLTEGDSFAFGIFIPLLLCTAVFCLLIYALGEIIEQLQMINSKLYHLNENTKDLKGSSTK